MSNSINHQRVMLANLRTGQRILCTVVEQGKSMRVEAEIVRVEIEHNYGRLWTSFGPLPQEILTTKYELVQG